MQVNELWLTVFARYLSVNSGLITDASDKLSDGLNTIFSHVVNPDVLAKYYAEKSCSVEGLTEKIEGLNKTVASLTEKVENLNKTVQDLMEKEPIKKVEKPNNAPLSRAVSQASFFSPERKARTVVQPENSLSVSY